MWTLWTPSVSPRWKIGSSYCRPFTTNCTLPPPSPRDLTLCSVHLFSPLTNKHFVCKWTKSRRFFFFYWRFFFSTESLGPNDIETFTATLVSMSKSKSSPHVSCLSMNRRSLKLRYSLSYIQWKQTKNSVIIISWPYFFFYYRDNSQNYMVQRNCQLIEITINGQSINCFKG